MLGRVGTVLDMIKVAVRDIQSALGSLSDFGSIESLGFRTL